MEVVVVVEVAIGVEVEPVEDAIVVVVDVLPVVDPITVPVVVASVRFAHQHAVLVRVDRVRVVYARAVPSLYLVPSRYHEWVLLVQQAIVVEVEWDVAGVEGGSTEWIVWESSSPHVRVQPVPDQVVILVYGAVPVIVEVSVVIHLAVDAGDLYSGVGNRIVAYAVVVGVDLMAGVRDAVVVVVDVVHVQQAVVVVVGVG